MKQVAILLFAFIAMGTQFKANAQDKKTKVAAPDKKKQLLIVEAACGECKFGLTGKSCDLAVRINGKPYFIDGTHIDSHGDAHAKEGFCNAIRKAQVQGEVIGDRFKATYFKLLPDSSALPITKPNGGRR